MKRPTGEVPKKFHHYRPLKNGLYRFYSHPKSVEGIIFDQEEAERQSLRSGGRKKTAIHCNKRLAVFPSLAGMSLTKLSLVENSLIFPRHGEFVSDIPAGTGKQLTFFSV